MTPRREDSDEPRSEAERALGRSVRQEMHRIVQIPNPWVAAVAIVILGAMQIVALQRGVDGALFGIVVAAIAGIAGYSLQRLRERRLDE